VLRLGVETLPLAQLSRRLVAVQSNRRKDTIRRREEIISTPRQNPKTHIETTLAIKLKLMKLNINISIGSEGWIRNSRNLNFHDIFFH